MHQPHPENVAKIWTVVILFFGICVGIALVVAMRMIERGESTIGAIVLGSSIGAFGACFVFFTLSTARGFAKKPGE